MKNNIFLTIAVFTCIFLSDDALGKTMQNSELDSLKTVLGNSNKKDTIYLENLITLARKTHRYDYEASLSYFNEAINLGKELKHMRKLIRAYNGLGITYGMHDNYAEAISSFNEGAKLAIRYGYPNDLGTSYGSMGIVYKRMGEYPTSLSFYTKSYQIYDSLNDQGFLASTSHNMGVLFDLMQEPDKALEHYNKSLEWYRQQEDLDGIADIHMNIGVLHLNKKEFDKAIELFETSLNYYQNTDDIYSAINAMSNLGNTYLKMGEYNMAGDLLIPALAMIEKENYGQLKIAILFNLAKLESEKGATVKSIKYALRCDALADSIHSLKSKSEAQALLSNVFEKAGQHQEALKYYKNYHDLIDSIFNENKVKSFQNQQVLMEVYEKDKQLETQKMELGFLSEKVVLENRWKWTLGLASLLLLLLGALYFQKYKQRLKYSGELEEKNALITSQNEEIERMNYELEKRMLRAQMNPHFIFNALSSIQHFISGNDKKSALHYLSHFSHMLRQVLESSVNTSMVLKDEIDLIRIYLELETLRFDHDFTYKINVQDALDTELIEIPSMVIQPFVENAILHGLMPKKGVRLLSIEISDKDKDVVCKVTDNGIGRKASTILNNNKTGKSPSRGISVSRQRLELLAKNHGLNTRVKYMDLEDLQGNPTGTQVIINIPKQEV